MRDSVFFFSDAHLGSGNLTQERQKEEKLLSFFEKVDEKATHIYVVGDLFDFWFEYRHLIPKQFQRVLSALGELKDKGVQIDYVCGNHDFWLGDFLPRHLGIAVHRDCLTVEHQRKKLFISHGDGLAKSDWGYRILKKILRNRVNIWLYRQLPSDFSIPFAKFVSGSSRDHTSGRENKFLEEYREFARQKLETGFDAVILGHTHQPNLEQIGKGMYVNLGDWFKNYSYGVLEKGEMKLEKFSG